ncbi:MAG: phosphomethylpyrimidine synthase [Sandaracinus sp.]
MPIHTLPLRGAHHPSSTRAGTSPGSFANRADVGGPLAYSSPDTPGMPAPSAKTAWDFLPDGWTRDASTGFAIAPAGFVPVTQLEHARLGTITPEMRYVAEKVETHLTAEEVRDEIAAGRMILPSNVKHRAMKLEPMVIGRASKTKVNANLGASPVSSGTHEEVEKMEWSVRWGADTVMDLSTGGDLDACREAIIAASRVPIGTVPIYSMILGRKIEDLTIDVILETLEKQAAQGVDYFTIHAGVRRAHLPLVEKRLIGIVSRGGSLLAKWMIVHGKESPMYEHFDAICDVMRRYDVSFAGRWPAPRRPRRRDGRRAARGARDARRAHRARVAQGLSGDGRGPGHVPFDQIERNMKMQRTLCHGAPFYVLGPIVTDVFPGYDHITSCIGATAAAYHGASMLCYVTPKEHVGLPKKDDVKQGCIAYKIAAHAADVALGIPKSRDWDDDLTRARAALNWDKHFELAFDGEYARALHDEDLDVDTDFCAMCGHDWCSVRISKEIVAFASGKAEGFEREKVMKSAALTEEQRRVLEQRGNLAPTEIHKLATKTKKAVDAEVGKGLCHSDFVEPETAQRIQKDRLVQLRVKDDAPTAE